MTFYRAIELVEKIRETVEKTWHHQKGCEFRLGNVVCRVPIYNKWDIWCTKSGTLGKTKKTRARFNARNPEIEDVKRLQFWAKW